MQKRLKQIAAAAIAALLALVFLSATIYNHNLPSVTAAMPVRGVLNQVELTTGIMRFADTVELASRLGGTVAAVLVREGETVRAGQPVIELYFGDRDGDLETSISTANRAQAETLATLAINRQRTQVDIERIESNIANLLRQIDEARADLHASPISDFELRQTITDIERTESDLSRTRELFDAGIAAAQEVRLLEESLLTLQARLSHQQEQYNQQQTGRQDDIARQISSLEHQLDLLERDLQSRALDLQALVLQEESLRRETGERVLDYQSQLAELADGTVLTAPIDGVVTDISVNRGQQISAGARLASFGQNLELISEIPLSNSFVTPGTAAVMHNASVSLTGVVTALHPLENSKRVTVTVDENALENSENPETGEISAGETFTVQFESTGEESFVLVPNSAVNRDADGYFLNQVRRRQGVLGTEFYTQRLPVYIGESDSEHTAIMRGITFFEPVTVLSDRAFSPGETVRLRNEVDFFE